MTMPFRIAAIAVLSLAQLIAAGWSIVRYESTLRSGTAYRIRTIAVDPQDAFRGRYVAVRPSIIVPEPIDAETRHLLEQMQSGETGYVVLATGDDGFARVAQVHTTPPAAGDYLKVGDVFPQWTRETQPGQQPTRVGYVVNFPFDRYYMNEAAAPVAEQRYFEAARRDATSRAWLAIRVKDGAGVIEGLFIDGVPIEEVIRK